MNAWICRSFAWVLVASIIIVSLVPPPLRPVSGTPHVWEHFAMFALCGYSFGLAYVSRHLIQALGLLAFCGLVETLQLLSPGRHARMSDFLIDAVASGRR